MCPVEMNVMNAYAVRAWSDAARLLDEFEPSSTDAAGVTSVCFGSRLDIFTLVRSTFDTSIQVVEGLDIAIAAAVFGYLVRFR